MSGNVLPLTREGFYTDLKDSLLAYAQSRNQANIKLPNFQYKLINPQETLDRSVYDRDLARNQRAFQRMSMNRDAIDNMVSGMSAQNTLNDASIKINEKVQELNRNENQRVINDMNEESQRKLNFDNAITDMINKSKVAQKQLENINMANFANVGFDLLMRKGQNYQDAALNMDNIQTHYNLMSQDAKDLFNLEIQKLQERYKDASNKYESDLQKYKNKEITEEQLRNSQREKDNIYKEWINAFRNFQGKMAEQNIALQNAKIKAGKLQNLYGKSGEIYNPYEAKPEKFQKGKILKNIGKGASEISTDLALNTIAEIMDSRKSNRELDLGDVLEAGLSFVPGLSLAASLAGNARDAYDEYKAGDLDYKDFIRYLSDTATSVIPGLNGIKKIKKLKPLSKFIIGSNGMSLSDKKELALFKSRLKEVERQQKQLDKINKTIEKKISDYIKDKAKANKTNNDRIWKILMKIV